MGPKRRLISRNFAARKSVCFYVLLNNKNVKRSYLEFYVKLIFNIENVT